MEGTAHLLDLIDRKLKIVNSTWLLAYNILKLTLWINSGISILAKGNPQAFF